MAPKKQSNAPRTNDEALTPVATYSARGNPVSYTHLTLPTTPYV